MRYDENRIRGESRIWGTRMSGLVGEVKPTHRRQRRWGGFTLIERLPSKGSGYILTESVNPANFPIQAGSLTCAESRATGNQAGWQSRERGNSPRHGGLWPVPKTLLGNGEPTFHRTPSQVEQRGTLSQSERQDKCAGCRQTNIRKHRKEWPGVFCWQSRVESRGEPLFDGRSLPVAGKQLGVCTSGLDGVKGGCTHGMIHMLKSGESLSGSADSADKEWYKPIGESRSNAWQDVGDGRSTDDRGDSITPQEERAISLDAPPKEEDACVIAQKATHTPMKRALVLRRRLCSSAKVQLTTISFMGGHPNAER